MKTKLAILVGVLIIGSGIFLYISKNYEDKATYVLQNEENEERKELLSKDTDGDGLKDWEEELWKTDISNPDSDGDGTTDMEEIRQGRNPAKPAPNDTFNKEEIENKVNPQIESDLTQTDKFSRELFARYARAREEGDASLDPYFDIFLKNISSELQSSAQIYYGAPDLDIVYTQNDVIFKEYANKLGEIFTKPVYPPLEHELVIFERAHSQQKKSELENLNGLITEYGRIRDEMLELTVPYDLVINHLDLLNATAGVLEGIQGMKLIYEDPIKAAAHMQRYPDSVELLSNSLKAIKQYFVDKNIVFGKNEPGYKFLNVI